MPVHSDADRPGIVHIVSGELVEHSSLCAVPIRHAAGETASAFGPTFTHWWANPTEKTVTAVSTDVVPFEMKDDTNM